MKTENELALIIAFYISKFDRQGIENLGYTTFNAAYKDIERKLGVKATSLKNRRDEFDPIHENERVGWYQRPMSPSRVRIVEQFSSISEPTLREIVLDIISGERDTSKAVIEKLRETTRNPETKRRRGHKFVLRGPTGRKAEELFIKNFREGNTPFHGKLEDCRDFGTGYDFKIASGDSEQFIEVKGLDGYTGGILFTDKEWRTAEQKANDYCLVVVSGLAGSPRLDYFLHPFKQFSPQRGLSTQITVSWSVPRSQLLRQQLGNQP